MLPRHLLATGCRTVEYCTDTAHLPSTCTSCLEYSTGRRGGGHEIRFKVRGKKKKFGCSHNQCHDLCMMEGGKKRVVCRRAFLVERAKGGRVKPAEVRRYYPRKLWKDVQVERGEGLDRWARGVCDGVRELGGRVVRRRVVQRVTFSLSGFSLAACTIGYKKARG